ncbi:MAG TPA: peptidylprolyl isomerase, partial [Thermodesulfobacteriota bacterium]
GWSIRDEINPLRYLRGTVGMALSGPDTGGSQFFVTHAPQPHLDGGYTVFGQVVEGMDVIDRIVQDDPITAVEVLP